MAQDSERELFADGVIGVAITGSVVRIDLGAHKIEPPPADGAAPGQRPGLEFRRRLVMPLDGFAQTFGMLEQVMRRLVEDSQKRRAETAAATAGGSGAPAAGASNGAPMPPANGQKPGGS